MITDRLPDFGRIVAVFFNDDSWACAARLSTGSWAYRGVSGDAPIANSEKVVGWMTLAEAGALAAQRREEHETKNGVKRVKHKVKNMHQNTAVLHEYNGEKLSMGGWAKKLGIHRTTIIKRLNRGLSLGQALGLEALDDGHKDPKEKRRPAPEKIKSWRTYHELRSVAEEAA